MELRENLLRLIPLELIIFTKIFIIHLIFFLHYGDLTDSNSIVNVLSKVRPDEIYNLGAQSHVGHSFEIPEYTSEVTGLGTLRMLEAMRFLNLKKLNFIKQAPLNYLGKNKIKLIHLMKNH